MSNLDYHQSKYIGILQDIVYRLSWRKTGGEAFCVFAGQVGTAIAGLVGVKLLTHVLTPTEYGKLSLANTIATLVGINLFGPFGQGLGRFWAISKDRGNLDVFYAVSNSLAKNITLIALLITVMVFVIMCILDAVDWAILAVISLIIGIISGIINLRISIFTAARQRVWTAVLNISNAFLRPLSATFFILVTVANAKVALIGYLIASLFIAIIAERCYSQNVSDASFSHLKLNAQKSSFCDLTKEIQSYSWPFLVWGIFSWIHVSCDRWALQSFHGPEVVGVFAVVSLLATYPLSSSSSFLSTLFAPIAFQRAGALTSKDSMSSANKILMTMIAIYILGAMLLIGFFALFHRSLILLISNVDFAKFSYLLPWLTLAWAFFYLGQLLTNFGMLANKPKIYIWPKILSALTVGSSTFYLSAKIGPVGVVLGLTFAGLIYAIWCLVIAIKMVKDTKGNF